MRDVFDELRRLDGVLATSDYVAGDRVTEADVRLLPTVERFDACYAPLFPAHGDVDRQDRPSPRGRGGCVRCRAWRRPWTRARRRGPTPSLFPLNPSGIVPVPPDGYSSHGRGENTPAPAGRAPPPASPASHHLANRWARPPLGGRRVRAQRDAARANRHRLPRARLEPLLDPLVERSVVVDDLTHHLYPRPDGVLLRLELRVEHLVIVEARDLERADAPLAGR